MDTKCHKCENTKFEVVNENPANSNSELMFIRCAKYKTAMGVLDYYNVGSLVKKLAKNLNIELNE